VFEDNGDNFGLCSVSGFFDVRQHSANDPWIQIAR
jgi:hypothetical protein